MVPLTVFNDPIVNTPHHYWATDRLDIRGDARGWVEEDGDRVYRVAVKLGENFRAERNGPESLEYQPTIKPQIFLSAVSVDLEGATRYALDVEPWRNYATGESSNKIFVVAVRVRPGCRLNRMSVVWEARTHHRGGIGG